ncbi:O-antigen ligase family protein [Oleisolibacter albus]|uniref:O-antigen ligase family protein n=1 Tax=Oleisolibacter albus TaxID=2171757 RepID=UPI000DF36CBA|nr:O-antigen ligase family protein [Oleisolibacter albus]
MSSTDLAPDQPRLRLLLTLSGLALAAILALAVLKPTLVLMLYGLVILALLALGGLLRPDLYLLGLTAFMALRPEEYLDPIGGMEGSSWYKLGLLGVLILYAARFGLLRRTNWPLLAMTVIAFYSLFNPDLYPALTRFQIIKSLIGLGSVFIVFNLAYRPQDCRRLIWVIALLPPLSVVGGLAEEAAGLGRMLEIDPISNVLRLQGGTIPAYLASLCFTGFVAALNEAILDRRRVFWLLAAVNLAILLATLGRMPLALCMLYALSLLLLLPFRVLGVERRFIILLAGSLCLALFVVAFADALISRFVSSGSPGDTGGSLNFMGRMLYWELAGEVLKVNPVIGRGLGTGIIFMLDAHIPGNIRAPHNEYLRLLVDGGWVGLGLFVTGLLALLRRQTRGQPAEIRIMAWTALLCLGIYSLTDNALSAPTAVTFFLYLALLLQRAPGPRELRQQEAGWQAGREAGPDRAPAA